mmetsp:Transcript_43952/g.102773  ORF Transcript_43952/g.102773 Transcript_43952/m.102773 type:complete len:225 (+) Transcript_43952:705-1379(+)
MATQDLARDRWASEHRAEEGDHHVVRLSTSLSPTYYEGHRVGCNAAYATPWCGCRSHHFQRHLEKGRDRLDACVSRRQLAQLGRRRERGGECRRRAQTRALSRRLGCRLLGRRLLGEVRDEARVDRRVLLRLLWGEARLVRIALLVHFEGERPRALLLLHLLLLLLLVLLLLLELLARGVSLVRSRPLRPWRTLLQRLRLDLSASASKLLFAHQPDGSLRESCL